MRLTSILARTPVVLALAATGALAAVTTAPAAATAAPPVAAGYLAKDLGTLGGTASAAVAVSTTGYMAGWADNAAGQKHAVRWNPAGVIQDLGTLGGATSEAIAVNDDGTVVGTAAKANGSLHAFAWTPAGGMRDLGTLGGANSSAADINRSGQVTGTADRADGVGHAFLWNSTTGMKDLGTLGQSGSTSAGYAINDAGQVAGRSGLNDGYPWTIFRWTPQNGMTDVFASLQEPAYFESVSTADINESGQIAGEIYGYSTGEGREGEYVVAWDPKTGILPASFAFHSQAAGTDNTVRINDNGQIAGTTAYTPAIMNYCLDEQAFRWDATTRTTHLVSTDLDCRSNARAINNSGEVAGWGQTGEPVWQMHALVWKPEIDGDMPRDLGTLGGDTSAALAISDTGRIVGTADTKSGASHAVRWDPPTGTTTASVVATADTYVNKSAPSTGFGFSSSLAAGGAGTYLSYLRFNVPAAPAGRHLVAATLRLHTNSLAVASSVDALEVRQASPYWSEAATTWNNRPTTNPTRMGNLGPIAVNTYGTVRLDTVQVTPGTALNLAVNSSGDSAWFWSRSYATTAFRPTLTLIYR